MTRDEMLEIRKKEILSELVDEEPKKLNGDDTSDWPTKAQDDMLDFIESQGIYIRQ